VRTTVVIGTLLLVAGVIWYFSRQSPLTNAHLMSGVPPVGSPDPNPQPVSSISMINKFQRWAAGTPPVVVEPSPTIYTTGPATSTRAGRGAF
jgi:hypothetical protein